jgi:hypothetical protein
MFMEIKEIPKEQVTACTFNKRAFLPERPDLWKQLFTGMLLGNGHQRKVQIIFCDDEGMKKVHTTIWAVDDNVILLKGGIWIPIARIIDIII